MKFSVGSLFSGIGGLELGLERTGGFKTIWNCEVNPYACAVLKKHWPDVPNLGDVQKVEWEKVERPDLLCGGFPCQDISNAGKKEGIKGKRSGLWKEFYRAIKGTGPNWVVVENVGAITGRGLDTVLADLRCAGYQAFRPILIEAASVGAPHHRERAFIVGYADNNGLFAAQKQRCLDAGSFVCAEESQSACELARPSEQCKVLANSSRVLLQGFAQGQRERQLGRSSWWTVEPRVGRVANGVSNRVDRIKCLGNAVVPQVAEIIGEAIVQISLG